MTDPSADRPPPTAVPKPFNPDVLESAIIAPPLAARMRERPNDPIDVIIDADLGYRETRDAAKQRILDLLKELGARDGVKERRTERSAQYVYAIMTAPQLRTVAAHQAKLQSRAGSASGTRPS